MTDDSKLTTDEKRMVSELTDTYRSRRKRKKQSFGTVQPPVDAR